MLPNTEWLEDQIALRLVEDQADANSPESEGERPLDEADQRTLNVLEERYFPASPSHESPSEDEDDEPEAPQEAPIPLWRNKKLWLAALVPAAAAGLTLSLIPNPPLTDYRLEYVLAYQGDVRGSAPALVSGCDASYQRGDAFRASLRPATTIDDEVVLAGKVQPPDREPIWLEDLPASGPVIEIEQMLPPLDLPPGPSTWTFYVMRRDERLPSEELASLPEGAHPGVTVVQASVCIVP